MFIKLELNFHQILKALVGVFAALQPVLRKLLGWL